MGCIDDGDCWHDRAVDPLQACSERAPRHVNQVVHTELPVPGPDVEALDALLDVDETHRSALPWRGAAPAAAAFAV